MNKKQQHLIILNYIEEEIIVYKIKESYSGTEELFFLINKEYNLDLSTNSCDWLITDKPINIKHL